MGSNIVTIDALGAVLAHAKLPCRVAHVREKLAVWFGALAAEILEDLGERVSRHRDLEQGVEQGDDAVVRTRLATEAHGLLVVVSLVDHAAREHGLIRDAKDDGSVQGAAGRTLFRPSLLDAVLNPRSWKQQST